MDIDLDLFIIIDIFQFIKLVSCRHYMLIKQDYILVEPFKFTNQTINYAFVEHKCFFKITTITNVAQVISCGFGTKIYSDKTINLGPVNGMK